MKLLIVTQKVDINDPVLGFFHRWIGVLSERFSKVLVICLEKGEYDLPKNVEVLSLGKEKGNSKIEQVLNFYKYVFLKRKEYDSVFVHMNQEYILLSGMLWKFFGKKIYMWRNHHAGNFLTDISAFFCSKTFSTSKFSYTVKYSKNVIMPVGIDTDLFLPSENIQKKPKSVLFIARVAPVKRPDLLLDALEVLNKNGLDFQASFYGDPNEQDREYYEMLKARVEESSIADFVTFYRGIPNTQTPEVYSEHVVSVNLSTSGMYDKTIFEALACKTLTVASNTNLKGLIPDKFIFKEGDLDSLVHSLREVLALTEEEYIEQTKVLYTMVLDVHSLSLLQNKLFKEISN